MYFDNVYAAAQDVNLLISTKDTKIRQQHSNALLVLCRKATRFVASEEITMASSVIGIEHPYLLMNMLRVAKLPHETVWIEWFNRKAMEAIGEKVAPDAPTFTGCFLETVDENIFRMTIIGLLDSQYTPKKNQILISPLSYEFRLDKPFEKNDDAGLLEKILEFSQQAKGRVKEAIKYSPVGSARFDEKKKSFEMFLDEENSSRQQLSEEFSSYCRVILTPLTRKIILEQYKIEPMMISKYLLSDLMESAGSWRIIVSMLAMMNAHEITSKEKSEKSNYKPKLINRKIVPYFEHVKVGLKIPRQNIVHEFKNKNYAGISIPEHKVSGSWRVHHTNDSNCEHVYEYVTSTHQRCIHCSKLKWWAKSYKRGNPEVGIIERDVVLKL